MDTQEVIDDCKLIVNYLPPSLTEDGMRNLFSPYGQIDSARLIVNKYTGQSLGYGFVRYSNAQSAQNAINELHNFKIENKVLKVNIARPASQSQTTNMYVSGLGQHVTKADLEEAFGAYGKISDSKIVYSTPTATDAVSRGIGFVRFAERDDAERAVAGLNDTIFQGSRIKVKFADTQMDKIRKLRTGVVTLPGPSPVIPAALLRFDPYQGMPGRPGQHQHANLAGPQHQYLYGAPVSLAGMGAQHQLLEAPGFGGDGASGADFTLFVYHLPQDLTRC